MATLSARSTDAPPRHIDIETGTPEHAWQTCDKLGALSAIDIGVVVPSRCRAVVLAPHPDDETLGCGGLIGMLTALGRQVVVIAVSDGEGSHPQESKLHARLPEMRARESTSALRHLGLDDTALQRVRIPDGAVLAHLPEFKQWLRTRLQPTDILFAPWRLDGHPDHEAVGHAASDMEQEIGCKLVEVPIWTWHWARPDDERLPWGRARSLRLTPDAERNKRLAMQCYRSQIGEDDGRKPVLPANVLAHFVRPYEVFFL